MHISNNSSLFLLVSIFATFVCGQDFNIPSDWRESSSSRPRSERLFIAQTDAGSLASAINASDGSSQGMDEWASANVPASLAQFDYVSGTQNYQDLVSDTITAFREVHPAFFDHTQTLKDFTSNALMWGLASFYGARAYNDTELLTLAASVWNVANMYAVSADDGQRGTQPTRNVSFTVNCLANVTSAGAVFWNAQQPSDLGCNAETVGAFVALSAHLWESTRNITYLNAAEQSASFIKTHMYLQFDEIITDTYELSGCTQNGLQFTHNQGLFLEGLSILASAPIAANATWTSLLQTLVISTVQFPVWTVSNGSSAGVLTEVGTASSDPTKFQENFVWRNAFIRALYEIWTRSNSSRPMTNFVEAFIMVQYNALLNLASNNGSFYSPIWTGPQLLTKVPWGQLSAMDVLSAALGMAPATNTTTGNSSTTSPTQAVTESHALSGGAIAGTAIGSISGVAIIIAGIWLVSRRRRSTMVGQRVSNDGLGSDTMHEVNPFPQGQPVIQPRDRPIPTAGYASKDREGYGYVPPFSPESSRPTALNSTEPPSTSVEDTTTPRSAGDTLESALTRAIQQVVDRMQAHDAPPSYTGQ